MSFLKKLFGIGGVKKPAPKSQAIIHNGYTIQPDPQLEGGSYRICASISREIEGELKTHRLIRADLFPNREEAEAACIRKAHQVIREQGDGMFG